MNNFIEKVTFLGFAMLILTLNPLYGQINSKGDTLIIKAIEVDSIDYKMQIAINYHLLLCNHKFYDWNKSKYIVWVSIDIPFHNKRDSIYMHEYSKYDFSKFKSNEFDPSYRIGVQITNKTSELNCSRSSYKYVYYYNYNGWDIIFVTNLPIEMNTSNEVKNFQISISKKVKLKSFEYKMSFFEISNYFVLHIVRNLIHGYGCEYNRYGEPYLSSEYLTYKNLSKSQIRRIRKKLDYRIR